MKLSEALALGAVHIIVNKINPNDPKECEYHSLTLKHMPREIDFLDELFGDVLDMGEPTEDMPYRFGKEVFLVDMQGCTHDVVQIDLIRDPAGAEA